MMQRHAEIDLSILNLYRKACPSLPQTLSEFLTTFGSVDPRIRSAIRFKTTCEQILNTGNLAAFLETWEESVLDKQYQNQLGLLLAIGYAIDRFETVLSFDIIKFLMDFCESPNPNPAVMREAKRLVMKVIAWQFLKH